MGRDIVKAHLAVRGGESRCNNEVLGTLRTTLSPGQEDLSSVDLLEYTFVRLTPARVRQQFIDSKLLLLTTPILTAL